jgi:CDP-glucose 4,6-dehydratase
VNSGFWRGRRVFVTGHTGFKGSWLACLLQRLGAEVAGYALEPPTSPSLFEDANVGETMQSTIGDVRDAGSLLRALVRQGPEIVFHLAAQPLVRASYADAPATFAVNVGGTVNLLEAVRETETVQVAVLITSDKCYENREWAWPYRETDALGGHDPYSASKACAEIVAASYRRSFFADAAATRLATARAGNVLGGGDWAEDRLVPDVVRSFLQRRPVVLRYPASLRPWQHVLDPLAGYLLLAESLWEQQELPRAWNFAPPTDDEWTVERVVSRLSELLPASAGWTADGEHVPHEAASLRLDASLARSILHWEPRFSLEETLELVAAWYANHAAGHPARELVDHDIDRYLSAVPA